MALINCHECDRMASDQAANLLWENQIRHAIWQIAKIASHFEHKNTLP